VGGGGFQKRSCFLETNSQKLEQILQEYQRERLLCGKAAVLADCILKKKRTTKKRGTQRGDKTFVTLMYQGRESDLHLPHVYQLPKADTGYRRFGGGEATTERQVGGGSATALGNGIRSGETRKGSVGGPIRRRYL